MFKSIHVAVFSKDLCVHKRLARGEKLQDGLLSSNSVAVSLTPKVLRLNLSFFLLPSLTFYLFHPEGKSVSG